MKLLVRVNEGRNLAAMDLNGLSDPYVKLEMGKQRFKSRVVKKTLNPIWGEEFAFKVDDLEKELVVTVMDEDKCFSDDLIGYCKIPVSRVFDSPNKSLGSSWYTLLPKSSKRAKPKSYGEISLTVTFSLTIDSLSSSSDGGYAASRSLSPSSSPSRMSLEEKDEKVQKSLADRIANMFNKPCDASVKNDPQPVDLPIFDDVPSLAVDFEELLRDFGSQSSESPNNLTGGVLLDQSYLVSSRDLNSLLFSPDSTFSKSLADVQGSSDYEASQWKLENDGENLKMKRQVTYVKAPTKLIKALKAFEEQTYLIANDSTFAVLSSVSTPDVMYGGTFKTEILYQITSGPETALSEPTSRLLITWQMNFLQSTMMKGMIENGARQGLKDSFDQFASFLCQTVKIVEAKESSRELTNLDIKPQSDLKLAVQYFANFTVFSTAVMLTYVLVHIGLSRPGPMQGLEFVGLDLPDSLGEIVAGGLLVLQCERLLRMVARFMKAKMNQKSDHGVKAQGDGWLLTIALIEGANLVAVDPSGFCDPYVVFTCNCKTRTSSIKFQKANPLWNEIFEFDAMDESPSLLRVEVFDFDGPFDEATSLGYAEVNFVKSSLSELADIWVPLSGKLAQACGSKLRLRIFLNNSKGGGIVKEYLTRMEKEVGKKINVRSPQANSSFQKLFGLSSEEFLINDFTCHLKRKMPLQGRLFLSARIFAFHANLFGHKTKFFFLWEDIDDIEISSPSLSSMGSPIIVVTLRKGKGADAKHGSRGEDELGRLKFKFHSFVSFNVAHRTIMALWKARSLSTEQKVKLVEEEAEAEESGTFVGVDDVTMSEVYSSTLSVPIKFLIELYGGFLDRRIMERMGCLNYSFSEWESEKGEALQRQVYYRLDKRVSGYRGEVTSSQQKMPIGQTSGWIVDEVMNLHGVPLAEYFNLHLRYQMEERPKGCNVSVSCGIAWVKATRLNKKISKNIISNLQGRLKTMFGAVEKEFGTSQM